jgi:hypothetical protein
MILIGTCHNDMEGPKRLENALNIIKPKVITVECQSNYYLESVKLIYKYYKEEMSDWVAKTKKPKIVKTYLLERLAIESYEVLTAINYAEKNHASIFFVDKEEDRHMTIDGLVQIFLFENMKMMAKEITLFMRLMGYKYARKSIMKNIDDVQYNPEEFKNRHEKKNKVVRYSQEFIDDQELREEIMAQNISNKMPDVHIGGIAHMFYYYDVCPIKPLYQRLGNIPLERRKLVEFDK